MLLQLLLWKQAGLLNLSANFIQRTPVHPDNLLSSAVAACLQSAEERHAAAIAALKAGWAAELKRQQASWEAGHAAKQDAWRAEKTKEIKEQTVKVNQSTFRCYQLSALSAELLIL